MAIINQSPAGQASRSLSGIAFDTVVASGTLLERRGRKFLTSPSVSITLGGEVESGGGPVSPTSGQIWPRGVI